MSVDPRARLAPDIEAPAARSATASPRRWDVLLVLAVAWTAHFALFRRLGLYEDDYFIVAKTLTWTWHDASAYVESLFTKLPDGRPIGFLLGSLVPFLCFRLGGVAALPLVYVCAFAIFALNALLVHRLLSMTQGRAFALIGALAFTLFPADTTHPFLVHAFVLQPALTFALLALVGYARGRRVGPYLLAAASLLTYEPGVLPFLAAPLIGAKWDPHLRRRWAVHLATLAGVVLAVFLLRFAAGEQRVTNFQGSDQQGDWYAVPFRMLASMVMGPPVSLAMFARRAADGLRWLGPRQLVLPFVFALPLLFAVFWRRLGDVPEDRRALLRAAATGGVMFLGGYLLEFGRSHFPPTTTAGRMTAVHMGGSIGAAIVVAAAISLAWSAARSARDRVAAASVTALLFASLWMFHIGIQKEFARSVDAQRSYWSRLVALMPDLSRDSLVILIGNEDWGSKFIQASSWSDAYVMKLLFRDASGTPPRLVGGYNRFEPEYLEARDGRLWWSSKAPYFLTVDRSAPLQREGIIVLEHTDRGWKRRVGSITFEGVTIPLPPPPAGAKIALEEGPLYPLLLGPRS